ncbi:MAG TPA: hypothetical protein VMN78_12995 [Longimicrobiales bacterium]|nr:hypothetical protein [Longimicrobiales bacterium]
MTRFVRHRRRGAATPLVFALAGVVACEDTPVFTEPEVVTFTAVAIDKASVRPREGERLTVGPAVHDVEFDVHWQEMPASSVLGVWLETHDSVAGQAFRWEGDLAESFEALPGSSGETRFTGTFTLPEVSPFCGSYDYLRILAVVFPGGESPPNEAYRDEVFYEVSGSDWSGPCLSDVFALFPGTDYRIGEPILVYGRRLPDALAVSLPGAQQVDNVWPSFIRVPETQSLYPVPGDGYLIAFIPVGAETGRLRAFAGSTEVRYRPDADVTLTISPLAADVFEPNNTPALATDSIYFDFWDPFAVWGAYGFNPSLTLTGADLTPDAVAPEYGEGDWFHLFGEGDATTLIDVCVNVAAHAGGFDDIDLIVYDITGAIAAQSTTPGGAEGVRVDDVSGADVYWVWVAPFLAGMTSSSGAYTYEVGHCAAATGTAIARPTEPLGFFESVGQSASPIGSAAAGAGDGAPTVRIGGSDERVPLAELRQRGGGR